MDYIAPHVDINTPQIAQDNLTPDFQRICPICFENWTGIGAQLIYHILQNHSEYLIDRQDDNQSELNSSDREFNDYIFKLVDNHDLTNEDDKLKPSTAELNEIVKVFIEHEKIFVLSICKVTEEAATVGFNVSVNYIGPYLNKAESMRFTCMLQYSLNSKTCLNSISEIVGETAELTIEDDLKEFKKPISLWPVIIKIQIGVPKKFQELVDAMRSRLTCFRCTAMMQPPIRHCRYGHIICKLCRQKIPTRPICPSCYNNKIEFIEKLKLSSSAHDIHPAMRSQMLPSINSEKLGTGDALQTVRLNIDEDVEEFKSEVVGNLRLLEEEALQVAYRCNGEKCNMWISYLDLEEHGKFCT